LKEEEMSIRSRSSAYWLSVLMVAASVSAAGAARAQNASIVPKSPVHPQSAGEAVKDNRLFHLTVINLSGQRRQVFVGKQRVDLPVGRAVGLDWTPGDTLHVVSDTDSRVNERINVSQAEMRRAVAIR
jgi:hypothetical protein